MNDLKNRPIGRVFKELIGRSRKAFIPFLTCGFPSISGFLTLFETLDKSGADIIEIGIPFSDPLADGAVIQATSKIALEKGINTDIVFDSIIKIRKKSSTPIAVMTYFNSIYHYGLDRFLKKAEESGINGLIIPDLPLEEFEVYRDYFDKVDIDNIMLASLTSTGKRLHAITGRGSGFLYCVSVKGVTGIRNNISPEVKIFLGNLRKMTDLPLALGFGLSSREQINQIKDYCDGIIIGSKILSMLLEARNFNSGLAAVENFCLDINKTLKGINR